MILLIASLVAGILTVLAPCTISLLPVIVGGALGEDDGRNPAFAVTLSLGLSVIIFTLLLKVSTSLVDIPQSFWQMLSGGIIFAIGLVMLFPKIWEKFSLAAKLNRSGNKLLAEGYKKKSLAGDILIGASLGPVFSSCSPTYFLIIATVLPRSFGEGIAYLLAYTLGLCGGLLAVTLLSQKVIERLGIAADPNGPLKRIIGGLFVLLGIAIIFGIDKQAELALANNVFDVTKIEQALIPGNASSTAPGNFLAASSTPFIADQKMRIAEKSLLYPQAPEIARPSGFINTDGAPITIGQFKGKKVVLIDFWTYSCINCQRTLPYVKAWYDKYSANGLEVISVHTPEFSFEKVQSNVEAAVKSFGIRYPVVLDNDYGTWGAFQNEYWPRKYLIDIDGFVVYDHAGEGDYAVTEAAIQKALAERNQVLGITASSTPDGMVSPKDAISVDATGLGSPETYFGAARNQYFANGTQGAVGTQNLSLPDSFSLNGLYLSGSWDFQPEYAEASAPDAKVVFKYQAKDVYFVASSLDGARVRIFVDGKPVAPGNFAGADVGPDGTAFIQANRLYKIVHGAGYGTHTLEIHVLDGRLDAYTFTFG